ncbi:MAG TPA: hypothetical protein VFY65_08075, partial [Longimicrobium sp.]|nr:hypothetical protein [Longimicrobium sp.]
MRTLPAEGPEHGARVGGFASSPVAVPRVGAMTAASGSVRRTLQRAMAFGALAGLGLEAAVLVPATLLLPELRLPWGLMLGASLALPLMMAVAASVMDLDSHPDGGAADGARSDAAGVP